MSGIQPISRKVEELRLDMEAAVNDKGPSGITKVLGIYCLCNVEPLNYFK